MAVSTHRLCHRHQTAEPARVNITSAVKVGANELEVSVVNLWPNRLIGDAALVPEKRFTETNMRNFFPRHRFCLPGCWDQFKCWLEMPRIKPEHGMCCRISSEKRVSGTKTSI